MELLNQLLFLNSIVENVEVLMADLMIWLCFMILFSSLYSYLIACHKINQERKRKRMMSNSKSMRRSRMRKQKQIEDLDEEACRLKNENDHLKQKIKATKDDYWIWRIQTMSLG
ncbi:hypothetical protein RYX36_029000, partial [Vicia faba]